MPTFTTEEIRMLMEGLDAIGKAESSNDMFGLLFSGMDKDTSPDERATKFERKMKEKEQSRADRDEKVILLKAKLIQVKQAANENSARLIIEQSISE